MATILRGQSVVRDRSYLRLLLILLGTATFFEGFDSAINAIVLPDLAKSFHLDPSSTRVLSGPIVAIGMGAFGALIITAIGDRIGRRPLLISTTIFYALFTGLTATATGLRSFATYQFFARMFLVAELATAITMVVEEFPADRRGRALGSLTAMGAFGLPVVAVVHLMVANSSFGWRWLYVIGLAPLLAVAFLRLRLKETARWQALREEGKQPQRIPFKTLMKGDYRVELTQVCALYFLTHFALLGATTWWPYYAANERHFTNGQITLLLSVAYLLGISGYITAGRLQDRIGRRKTGALFLVAGCLSGVAVFQIHSAALMFPAIVLAVFFGFGISPVVGALAAELFPTEIRATSVAFARSIFGTAGAITGPLVVSLLADKEIGVFGNLGDSVSVVAAVYLIAALVLQAMPETQGRELESIMAASGYRPDAVSR